MSIFKRRRFPVEIILVCVRWYCKYGITYRDLAEMMQERGVEVDASTIFRWVQRYAPELEKRIRWYQGYRSSSWRVDETYVKVGGQWKYLFRAVDKHGRLIDFMLLDRRNTCAAHRFLGKALKTMRNWPPHSITTDKLGSYPKAIRRLQREAGCGINPLFEAYVQYCHSPKHTVGEQLLEVRRDKRERAAFSAAQEREASAGNEDEEDDVYEAEM